LKLRRKRLVDPEIWADVARSVSPLSFALYGLRSVWLLGKLTRKGKGKFYNVHIVCLYIGYVDSGEMEGQISLFFTGRTEEKESEWISELYCLLLVCFRNNSRLRFIQLKMFPVENFNISVRRHKFTKWV
jgi:hypothetical protein